MRASVTDTEDGTRYKSNSWESSESQHSTPAAQAGVSAATPGKARMGGAPPPMQPSPKGRVRAMSAVDTVEWCDDGVEELEPQAKAKPLLLGLPCAKCGAYYDSQLTECPICGCSERVKPTEAPQFPKNRAA